MTSKVYKKEYSFSDISKFITRRHSFSVVKLGAGVITSSIDQFRQLCHRSRERVLGHSLLAPPSTSHHEGGSEVNPAGRTTDSYNVNLIFWFTRTEMLQVRYIHTLLNTTGRSLLMTRIHLRKPSQLSSQTSLLPSAAPLHWVVPNRDGQLSPVSG